MGESNEGSPEGLTGEETAASVAEAWVDHQRKIQNHQLETSTDTFDLVANFEKIKNELGAVKGGAPAVLEKLVVMVNDKCSPGELEHRRNATGALAETIARQARAVLKSLSPRAETADVSKEVSADEEKARTQGQTEGVSAFWSLFMGENGPKNAGILSRYAKNWRIARENGRVVSGMDTQLYPIDDELREILGGGTVPEKARIKAEQPFFDELERNK